MLTRVYEHPVNYRDSTGKWQALSETQSSPSASGVTPSAERNPLGQEDETACTFTSTAPTTSACNELTFKAGYETSGSATRHALISFVLPDLHEEQTILSAQLELYVAKTTTTSKVAMGAYRVTAPWGTGATWNTTNGGTPWSKPGGDYANPEKESDAAINSAVGAKTGWAYWYPTRMVQEWYNGSDAPAGTWQPDFGFLLKDVTDGATNNTVTFDGREERTNDPGLTIEWVQRGVGNSTKYTQVSTQLSSTQSLQVDPASGNLMIHSNDLQIPSKGLEFDSARSWNSLTNEAPGYGYGWTDSNAVYVQIAASGNAAYTDNSGNTFPFIKEGMNFKTPSGIEATMCEAKGASPCPATLPSGTSYQVIYSKTGQRINFGHKEGTGSFVYYYVVSVEDASGDKQTASYTTGLEDPTSWIDTESIKITYTESEAKGYTKITANTQPARSTSYTESLGEDGLYHLTEYANEKSEKTKYRYGGESYLESNLLTEITEPSGNVTKLYYNSNYQIAKLERLANGQKTGPTTVYTYYEAGNAPAPCVSPQKATVVKTPENEEKQTIYCSNVLDEVERTAEIYRDTKPPVFSSEFEASAYLEPGTGIATVYFAEAEEPTLPNGEPGSGIAHYTYRYRVNGGAFSEWAQTVEPEFQVSGVSGGSTILLEVYATDNAGNVSATASASAAVPQAGEGNPIGEEGTEEDPSLKETNQPEAEGVAMSDGEDDSELESGPALNEAIQPAFTRYRTKIAHRGTLRGNANALVVGTAVPGMTDDAKAESGSWTYGRLYKYAGVCGWVQTVHFSSERNTKTIVNTCPASRGIPVKNYASLINCDTCNASSFTTFEPERNAKGEPVNTSIPVFANVRPYTKESPHEVFRRVDTVKAGAVQGVGWRYITKSGKYALVSIRQSPGSKSVDWAFVEAKYLPSTTVLCHGAPRSPTKHKGWPHVCKE
jgi:hypothetical protein